MLNDKSRAWAEIDLTAIEHNVNIINKIIPDTTKIMGIVKANAYGHGSIVVSKKLKEMGIDFFGVSSIDEALELSENDIKSDILILGYTPPNHFHYLKGNNFIQTAISYEYAFELNEYAKAHNQIFNIHIKVDTGMGRVGIPYIDEDKRLDLISSIFALSNLLVKGIFTHLSVADDTINKDNVEYTYKQKAYFDELLEELTKLNYDYGVTHIQNSYAIINHPDWNYDYVRPGIALYGGELNFNSASLQDEFKQTIQLKASISYVKHIKEQRYISYGRNFKSNIAMKIATVSIGYADGIPRNISNKNGQVLVNGQYANIIGNVCMDQLLIDVTNINVSESDIVTIIGTDNDKCLLADNIAKLADTINNEVFTNISVRVPRIYK